MSRFNTYLTIFIFFFSVYLLSMGGHGYSGIGTSVYEVTRNIILKHSFSIEPNPWGKTGLDGKFYSQYGLGHSLYNIPFYLLGHSLCRFNPVLVNQYRRITMFTTLLGGPFITSLTAVLVFVFCLKLGFQRKTSVLLTFIYGIGTMAWPYAKFDFTEPILCFLITGTVFLSFCFKKSGQAGYLLGGSLLLALGIITKIVIVIIIPFMALYVFWGMDRKKILIFAGPILLGFIAWWVYNFIRFGDIFTTGYKNEFDLDLLNYLRKFMENVMGARGGIFLYSPVLIFFLFGFGTFCKRHRKEARLFLSIILVFLLFYPLTSNECYYGPRYLVSLMPLMVIPIGAMWDERKGKRWFKNLFYFVFIASVMVQFIGVVVNYRLYRWKIELVMPKSWLNTEIGRELMSYPDTAPFFGNVWLIKEAVGHIVRPSLIPKNGVNFYDNYKIENAWLPYYGVDIWWLNPNLTKFK